MLTKMIKPVSWTALLLLITALLAAGCGTPRSVPQTPAESARDSFSARAESEDGAIVAWSGYTDGYEPAAEAKFDIAMTNETERTWRGRFCLQLLDRQLPQVIATLEQRPFTLEPGVGFSDTITVQFPEGLDEGAYGLSLAVRRPGGPLVDLVPIQIGETDETRRPTTQRDMDASLEACPPSAETESNPSPCPGRSHHHRRRGGHRCAGRCPWQEHPARWNLPEHRTLGRRRAARLVAHRRLRSYPAGRVGACGSAGGRTGAATGRAVHGARLSARRSQHRRHLPLRPRRAAATAGRDAINTRRSMLICVLSWKRLLWHIPSTGCL